MWWLQIDRWPWGGLCRPFDWSSGFLTKNPDPRYVKRGQPDGFGLFILKKEKKKKLLGSLDLGKHGCHTSHCCPNKMDTGQESHDLV